MKIIFKDEKTNEAIAIYHDPKEIIIKPKSKRVKIIVGPQKIIEYNYVRHVDVETYDAPNDILEKETTIFVHANTKQEYESNHK